MAYSEEDLYLNEFIGLWYPIFKRIYRKIPVGLIEPLFRDPSWRMIPMSTPLQRPDGARHWLKSTSYTYAEDRAYDEYIPFYHALKKMGVGEIAFISCDSMLFFDPEDAQDHLETGDFDKGAYLGFVSNVEPQPRDEGTMPGPYVAFSAEGSWSFYMTTEEFGFLCGPPEVLQYFFDHWGGEEVLYKRFVEFDMGYRWFYSLEFKWCPLLGNACERHAGKMQCREDTYRLAGWGQVEWSAEQLGEEWPCLHLLWGEPEWRMSKGYWGPQINGDFSTGNALRAWDTYLDKRNNENPEARPWAALSRVAPTYDWCYSPEGYTQRSLTQSEVSAHWRPLVQRIYRTLPQGQLDVTFRDPSWRMVPLSTHLRDPYGTRDWLESLIHYREEDRAYNEYFPFYHALRKMGVEEIAFLDCASLLPPDASAAQDVPLGSATNLVFPAEQDCTPGGLYVAVSAEGGWSFHMTGDGFGFLCAGPDVMQHFFDHWGGEEALYQRFTEYDLGGRWAYHLDKARSDLRVGALRRETYRLVGWQAPEMSPEQMRKNWPWRDPRWEDPVWRVSQGFHGPQIAGGSYDVKEALRAWDLYLESRDAVGRAHPFPGRADGQRDS